MFSYYGSKIKIAKAYDLPKYDLVIEPFAGAAWYSLLHKKQSLLNDSNNVIYDIWNWLINDATTDIILANKDFYVGQDISSLPIAQAHKDFIGFCINRGSIAPKNIVQKWSCQVKDKPNWASTTAYSMERAATLLPFIKNWEAKIGDYKNLPDIEATWFIDPPYQTGGHHYVKNQIDYRELGDWCKSRKGQVIVCENTNANWLDFKPLIEITGQRKKTMEAVWYN